MSVGHATLQLVRLPSIAPVEEEGFNAAGLRYFALYAGVNAVENARHPDEHSGLAGPNVFHQKLHIPLEVRDVCANRQKQLLH